MRWDRAVVAAVVLVASAGCGSTVQQHGTLGVAAGTGGGLAGGELGANQPAGSSSTGGSLSSVGAGAGTGLGSTAGGRSNGAGGAVAGALDGGSGGTGSGGAGGAAQVGITATAVYVGIATSENADTSAVALGAGGFTSGNTQADAQAVVDDINAHGGLAGRKIVPIFHAYNATSTDTSDQQQEAACADYTQDHHVFAVADSGRNTNFFSCVTKTAVAIGGFDYGYGQPDFAQFPYLIDVNTINLEREMGAWVQMLARQQYGLGWNTATGAPGPAPAKFGVLTVDFPSINTAVNQVLLPQMAAHGMRVEPANVIALSNPSSRADTGNTVAQIQGATLKFQSNGVTHVVLIDDAGGVTLFFTKDAASQKYYPRMGISTENALEGLLEQGLISAQQANGAMGLGWEPTEDIPGSQNGDSSPYSTTARRHCLAVMAKAGQTFSSTNAELIALEYCDNLYFLQTVFSRMSPANLTRAAFMQVVNTLGSGYVASTLVQTALSATQHDAVRLGYDLRYNPACTCMGYYGAPIDLG